MKWVSKMMVQETQNTVGTGLIMTCYVVCHRINYIVTSQTTHTASEQNNRKIVISFIYVFFPFSLSGIVMMKKKVTESNRWAVLAPNFEDLRETVMHVPVRCDCPSILKRNGGDMARLSERNTQPFSSVHCVIFFKVFRVGTRSETAKPLTASSFLDHIYRSKFRHMSALPRSILNGLRWTFATWTRITLPYPVVVRLSTSGGSILHIDFWHGDDRAI